MPISRTIATGVSAVALATSGLMMTGAGVGATAAVAAPAGAAHCPTSGGKYPPGKCVIFFTHSSYKHGSHVTFTSGNVFKPGEEVNIGLFCPKVKHQKAYSTGEGSTHAHSNGSASSSFRLSGKAHGTCVVTLHGLHSDTTLKGSFKVKS